MLKRIHQSSLFLSFVLGIIFGTIFSVIFRINFFSSALWLIFVLILLTYSFFNPARLFLILIFLAGGILANFRVSLFLKDEDPVKNLVGESLELTGRISADPSLSGANTVLKLTDLTFSSSSSEFSEKPLKSLIYVQTYVPKSETLKRGYFITLKGKLTNGFGAYSASLFRPELLKISRPSGETLIDFRDAFADSIKSNLSADESSLGLAYLLGLRNGLSEELVEILAAVGLTHLVVASGTHLSILIELIKKLFGRLSRFSGFLFSILFILLFAELIGWTASITRACIVSLLSLSAWYSGRKLSPLRIILISMSLTLLLDPMNLTNLGWLLSFASFSGILILAPALTKFFYEKKPKFLSEIFLATLSATLMTAPILLYYFGSLSLISLLANLLILPTVSLAMGFTFLTGIFGLLPASSFLGALLSPLKFIVVKITTFILDYHLLIMRFFGSEKVFLITLSPNNPLVFLLYLPLLLPFLILGLKKYFHQKSLPCPTPRYFVS